MAIKIENEGTAAYITSPYNPDFVQRVKALGGRWDASRKQWKISVNAVDAAREIMSEIYGETDVAPAVETVTLIVNSVEQAEELHGSITLAGKTIAAASGRDSGARIGEDVAFRVGAPESSGSVKNWRTRIPEGCTIEVYNVPKAKAEEIMANPPSWASICIKDQVKIDRAALEAEKTKLLARLAEIEGLLERKEKSAIEWQRGGANR